MIETQNLTFQYDGGPVMVFPDISATANKPLLVLGPSGKGKTTLLHLLSGLLQPKTGEVKVMDQQIFALSEKKRDHFRGQHIGIIFQKSHLIKALTALENVLVAQVAANETPDIDRATSLLTQLGLGKQLHQKSFELSVGEQQRVAIARAVVNQPKVVIADEPTSALDDSATTEVIHLLEKQAKEAQAALIIVTHDSRLTNYFKNQVTL